MSVGFIPARIFLSTPSARRATRFWILCSSIQKQFLSTPSARRATRQAGRLRRGVHDFYPRPPRGGRLCAGGAKRRSCSNFYPRPPRGGRLTVDSVHFCDSKFLSTPSARRATEPRQQQPRPVPISIHALREEGDSGGADREIRHLISIHALREEGDPLQSHRPPRRRYFYPRPPRGGRQQKQRQNLYFLINYTTFCTNLEEP